MVSKVQIIKFGYGQYSKIPNISPGLIEVFKHFLGGLYSGGLIFGGLIFGGQLSFERILNFLNP